LYLFYAFYLHGADVVMKTQLTFFRNYNKHVYKNNFANSNFPGFFDKDGFIYITGQIMPIKSPYCRQAIRFDIDETEK